MKKVVKRLRWLRLNRLQCVAQMRGDAIYVLPLMLGRRYGIALLRYEEDDA